MRTSKLRMAKADVRPGTPAADPVVDGAAVPLSFTVFGIPQPKGSTRVVPIARQVRSLRDVRVTSDNPQVKQWQGAIKKAAWCAKQDQQPARDRGVLVGPVALEAQFYLPRPQRLPKGHEVPHTTKPDLDKLLRALKDALTSTVWDDDSQVTEVHATKQYARVTEQPRVVVTVWPVEPALFQSSTERTV